MCFMLLDVRLCGERNFQYFCYFSTKKDFAESLLHNKIKNLASSKAFLYDQ